MSDQEMIGQDMDTDIAIIGMSGRFPGAQDIDAFWQNLRDGVESIVHFSDEELLQAGVDPSALRDPNYVKAGAILEGIEQFDAAFFGLTPKEAQIMDPQQRLFLETAWNALESTGYDPEKYHGAIGLFAGTALSTYLLNNLHANPEVLDTVSDMQLVLGNDKDALTTRVAYLLNLTGPCYSVQTFCSTSLVSICVACSSLLSGECDMALAGGVMIAVPQKAGYYYEEGGVASPDARCRAFDAEANGSPLGSGVAIVVLKRLSDALKDGDTVHAVIKGWAINNDGSMKVGYTAPGVTGQANVITEALANAEISPQSIDYIEAHGTGTVLGDAVELAALIKAFEEQTEQKAFCALGSAKTNVGHLDRAAGATGLIKTVLSLKHALLPPSLNYHVPNTQVDLTKSPFYVNTQLRHWPESADHPRRAGVSAFGIGGTNAHVIVEEAPKAEPTSASRPNQLLLLSAKTKTALQSARANLSAYLQQNPTVNLADVAYTLQVGRKRFNHRSAVVVEDNTSLAIEALNASDILSESQGRSDRPVVFLFSGVGEQYAGMAQELYQNEPIFRHWVDHCCEVLRPHLDLDLRDLLWPKNPASNGHRADLDLRAMLRRGQISEPGQRLRQTRYAQPTVFVIEYALTQLLLQWGIVPKAMLGYSLGEYVAACVAGAFTLEEGLRLVAHRAALIDALPAGAMLAVSLSEEEITPYLHEELDLAITSGPGMSVLAGPLTAIAQVERQLQEQEIVCMRVETTHAFHSRMLEPIGRELNALLQNIQLSAPQIPYISNMSGTWITAEEATDPTYWVRQMCQTVRFTQGISQLVQENQAPILLEIGPGQGLSSLVKQHPACQGEQRAAVFSTIKAAYEHGSDQAFLLETVAKIWMAGGEIDWQGFYGEEVRQRIPLPTYPFERQRYWIEPVRRTAPSSSAENQKKADPGSWFYTPSWEVVPLRSSGKAPEGPVMILLDEIGTGEQIAQRLESQGRQVIRVSPDCEYCKHDTKHFSLSIADHAAYSLLLADIHDQHMLPSQIIHCWSITNTEKDKSGDRASFERMQEKGLYSLLALTRALDQHGHTDEVELSVVSNHLYGIDQQEIVYAEKATLAGACKVIAQEYPGLRTRTLDVGASQVEELEALAAELMGGADAPEVAYRAGKRWEQRFLPLNLEKASSSRLRTKGVYLITGGLGGVGLKLAEALAQQVQARLILVGRNGIPPKAEWGRWLQDHPEDEHTSRCIRAVRKMEERGADVSIMRADVANEQQMRDVIHFIDERFGRLDGVIHCAGYTTSDAFQYIQEVQAEECERHFQAKVYGLYVMERVLQGRTLDFCMIFSSLSSVLGGLGFCAYTAANAFIDAFVYQHNQHTEQLWSRVNWDTWLVSSLSDAGISMGGTVAEYAMTAEEGVEAFQRALASKVAHIVNSTGDLQQRIRQWIYLDRVRVQPTAVETEPVPTRTSASAQDPLSADALEQRIRSIWQRVLGLEHVDRYENFFDLGGNSFIGLQVISKMRKELQVQLPVVALFEAPTIHAMAQYLRPSQEGKQEESSARLQARRKQARQKSGNNDIAIVGMTGRFPGANSVEQFWQNLVHGQESIRFFSEEELLAAGHDPEIIARPNYVRARPVLDDVAGFDAALFGYSPREAELMDPQHRLFLESCWEVLELAGYDPSTYAGLIGVYAGSNISTYLHSMLQSPDVAQQLNIYQMVIGNDKDALTTTVSYKLDLKGPSFAIQTFCSTSLVAVHLASQGLLHGECDLALAGGVSIRVPTLTGHLYEEGGMESPDGHCRTFDEQARGGMFGDGVGVVALKRLEDALEDGDTIHAVIKGSAINNDGSLKVSYTAPSVQGQADVVNAALESSGVEVETIQYIEAHGTATVLGDPIEVASLTRAFRQHTKRNQYCAIGSVKTNVGHLDRAAGVSGLIKVVESLKHRQIPASLHYQAPNPAIDFVNSPFYVNAQLAEWPENIQGQPRRAGINSLGMGGTNVHVVIEEAPVREKRKKDGSGRREQLIVLSAKTESALEAISTNLSEYLQEHRETELSDIAYTLQVGRRSLERRRIVIGESHEQVIAALESGDPARVVDSVQTQRERPIAFLFSGVGEHYVGMARELYQQEAEFRKVVDRCCELLHPHLGLDLRTLLWPKEAALVENSGGLDLRAMLRRKPTEKPSEEAWLLKQTRYAQPAVFVIEYALSQVLIQWGIRPQAMLGYSLGEYVAACVAGVFTLEEGLRLVARRAALIDALPAGAMLAVTLSWQDVQPYLNAEVSLAVSSGPNMSILSGTLQGIEGVERRLEEVGLFSRRLETTHAFHSKQLEAVAEKLRDILKGMHLREPQIPYLSNVTGEWIKGQDVQNPEYWVRQMCETVRFGEGLEQLGAGDLRPILVEVGVGQAFSSLVKQYEHWRGQNVLPTLRASYERQGETGYLLRTVGRIWLEGGKIDWDALGGNERRQRIPLPTYPFEHQHYWVKTKTPATTLSGSSTQSFASFEQAIKNLQKESLENWYYLPAWKRSIPLDASGMNTLQPQTWLLLADENRFARSLQQRLEQLGQDVVLIKTGSGFERLTNSVYSVRPDVREHYEALFKELRTQRRNIKHIVHLWTFTSEGSEPLCERLVVETLEKGFNSLLCLAQTIENNGLEGCQISVISNDLHSVTGNERLRAEKATLLGPCRVIPLEYPHLTCRNIDITLPRGDKREEEQVLELLLKELSAPVDEAVVALRGSHRWLQTYEPVRLTAEVPTRRFRQGGVYLITGGLGGVGLGIAAYLARTFQAKLVLLGRSALPDRESWSHLLATEDLTKGIGYKLTKLLELEALGAEVLTLAADVACEEEMQLAISQALTRFGTIHGVIHAAGIPGIGLMQTKSAEQAVNVLAPKVMGTLVLEKLLRKLSLDFLVLCSSITSFMGGGPGQVDYCAANAFLDAFAQVATASAKHVLSINWGEWQWNAWEAGLEGYDKGTQQFFRDNRKRFGISFEDGAEALRRVLTGSFAQVIISPQDFRVFAEVGKTFTAASLLKNMEESQQGGYPRPSLSSAYVAPSSEIEHRIVTIWENLLGIEKIGVEDNFFELGGHSLMGTQLMSRLRNTFQVNLSLSNLFEAPTVTDLATIVELALLDEIDMLEEEEVEQYI